MSAILRNVRIGKEAVKVEPLRGIGIPPEEAKRYSMVDLRRVAAEAESRARLAAEEQAEQVIQAQEERLTNAMGALEEGERALHEARVRLFREAAPQLMELVLAVVRKIVRTETEVPGTIAPLVEEMLQRVGHGQHALVRLAPADLGFLRQQGVLPESEARGVRFASDERIAPGGCVVETERGSWDAQVETQLERIEEALRATLAEWIDEEAA